VITEEVRQLMMNQASIQEIKQHIKLQGIRFLVDDGLIKVKAGKTTLEEVLRVASINE
jgi:type IV pilus assembly protein PilB